MQNNKGKESKRKPSYFVDRKLLPRVKEYLDSNTQKGNDTIDDALMYLQTSFPEYGRRKQHTLRLSVTKAFNVIKSERNEEKIGHMEDRYLRKRQKRSRSVDSKLETNDDSMTSDDSDFSLNDEPLVEYKDSNAINNVMQNLYKSRNSPSPVVKDENIGLQKEESNTSEVKKTLQWVIDKKPTLKHMESSGKPPATSSNDVILITQQPINIVAPNVKDVLMKEPSDQPILHPISEDDKSLPPSRPPSRPGTPLSQSVSKSARKSREGTKEKVKKFQPTISNITFKDVGGYPTCIQEISKLLFHLKHPKVFKTLGIKPPRGFLLHGPPGCGKTLLANAIAGELQIPFFKVASTEVVSGISGETEQKIRNLFSEAIACAPSILFIDEIDSITPKRENAGKEMERRIVTQILTSLDELATIDGNVLVIGATNRVDALDPALRRAGRFDREIAMGIPDRAGRKKILEVLCGELRLCEEFSFDDLARQTPGFVGADLQALIREAAMCAVNRIFESLKEVENVAKTLFTDSNRDDITTNQIEAERNMTAESNETAESNVPAKTTTTSNSWLSENLLISEEQLNTLYITNEHFKEALPHVQPSSKREGFATVPDVTWEDIGALQDIREELKMAIMAPVQNPIEFESLGLTAPPGILLAGPPGCGKTLLAKAVANEAGINFISVKGPELLNMYVGESERAVRQVFERARNSSPCVIFFDEIDALCPRRSETGDSSASSRVVNQLLTEMDGVQARKQVFIMGATNRPDILDRAILRPGRLDKLLYVGLPNACDRTQILLAITKNGQKPRLHDDISIKDIAEDTRCDGYSGADLSALVREASVCALKQYMKDKATSTDDQPPLIYVKKTHFDMAFAKVKPSVTGNVS